MAGAVLPGADRADYEGVRKLFKTASLGVLYGQSEYGIADRLGIEVGEARSILDRHRSLFARYWDWSRVGRIGDPQGHDPDGMGWPCRVPAESNPRTWMNWPIQATGGDLMRLVVTYLDQQGVRVLAPVHDGFLLSCHRDRVEDLRAAVDIACETACEQALGYRLTWDLVVHGGRYRDKDGLPLWDLIGEALGALHPGHVHRSR